MSDPRYVLTPRLKELVRKDPLCSFYRRTDELSPAGTHLVMMVLPMVNVENIRAIMVSRIEVYAKLTDTKDPAVFMLEIPHADFEALRRIP